jgi:hypothetical protein
MRQLPVEVLQGVREIALFLVNQDRIAEPIDRADQVSRYNIPPFDDASNATLDRFTFSLERAVLWYADFMAVRFKNLRIR